MSKWMQINYRPQNINKYLGDTNKIFCRSSYEVAVCRFLDYTPEIKKWNLEGIEIKYFDPVREKVRTYIMDFVAQIQNPDGSLRTVMIEAKPSRQCKPPLRGQKSEKTFTAECNTYRTNDAKWSAARATADELGWQFIIVTEKEIFAGIDKPIKVPKKPRKARSKTK